VGDDLNYVKGCCHERRGVNGAAVGDGEIISCAEIGFFPPFPSLPLSFTRPRGRSFGMDTCVFVFTLLLPLLLFLRAGYYCIVV